MEMIVSVTSRSYSQWEGNITEMLSWLNIFLSALRSWFGLLSYHIEKTIFVLISQEVLATCLMRLVSYVNMCFLPTTF